MEDFALASAASNPVVLSIPCRVARDMMVSRGDNEMVCLCMQRSVEVIDERQVPCAVAWEAHPVRGGQGVSKHDVVNEVVTLGVTPVICLNVLMTGI